MDPLKVKDLLEFKSNDKMISVLAQSTVSHAAAQMKKFKIGFMLVIKSKEIRGVLSERDITDFLLSRIAGS